MKYRRQPSDLALAGPRRRRRGLSVVPTLFTLGNCVCGFASLHYASYGSAATKFPSNYAIAAYLVFAAMLFDMFDGFMARLTHTSSTFGAELDSLADMISFGVAPAYLALHVINDLLHKSYVPTITAGEAHWPFEVSPSADSALGSLFWVIGALYVCCTALRLARFNVTTQLAVESHMNFRGLPSPGAAGVVVSSVLFFEALNSTQHVIPFPVPDSLIGALRTGFPWVLPVVVLAAALLMVSRFAYAHLINRFLRGRRRFNYIVRIVIIGLLVFWQPQITALAAIYLYAMSAPAVWLWRLLTGKAPPPATRPATVSEPPAPTP